jgi:hypothetical protein
MESGLSTCILQSHFQRVPLAAATPRWGYSRFEIRPHLLFRLAFWFIAC